MEPRSLRNIVLGVTAAIGLVFAALVNHPADQLRPFMLLLGLLLVLKLNLEYLLGLPMGVTYSVTGPRDCAARRRVLVVSWLLIPFMIYGYFKW
jgi:hypothetical protein